MQYSYTAYNLDDGIVQGKFEAEDETEAREGLISLGLNPLRIKKPSQFDISQLLASFSGAVKPKEVDAFARQAATMLASGSNLLRVLEMSQTEGASKAMVRVLQRVHDRVSQGESFTIALREYPKVFDEVFVSLVEVGEHTGKLGPALQQLADIMSQAAEAKAKAVKAMMMPIFLIGTSLMMLGFMVFVAFPPLIDTFNSMGVEVPLMTRVLIGGVSGAKDNIVNLMIGIFAVVFAYKIAGTPRTHQILAALREDPHACPGGSAARRGLGAVLPRDVDAPGRGDRPAFVPTAGDERLQKRGSQAGLGRRQRKPHTRAPHGRRAEETLNTSPDVR